MILDRGTRMAGRRDCKSFAVLMLLCLVVACTSSLANSRSSTFGIRHHPKKLHDNEQLFQLLRGGSTAEATEADGGDIEDPEKLVEKEDDDEEEEDPLDSVMSTQPVRLLVQTNWGNTVVDHRVELMAARTRNVASLKKSLSRLFPGRPPVLGLELVFEGRILEDEMLVDELFDEDDEEKDDEDEDSDEAGKILIVNAVPPVDPKFATELAPKLRAHAEDDDETLSTEELIDAYFLNQAAMARNAQLLADPNAPSSSILRLEIQEQAKALREQLQSQVPEDVWASSLEPVRRSHHMEERRGQRYRSGKGGARTNLKKSIQTNLNIQWGETIRNFLLFLFFGYFGGRNSVSRTLMLWGAPLCFILQARPVKMWSKVMFYMISNPPGIVLSLLPAPQQALLSMDMEKAYAALYSTEEEKATAKTKGLKSKVAEERVVVDDEYDEESEVEDESEAESESEGESEDEDDIEDDSEDSSDEE